MVYEITRDGGNAVLQEKNVATYKKSPAEITGKFTKNRLYLALFALFFGGMIYGTMLISISPSSVTETLGFITQGFISSRAGQPLTATFLSSLSSVSMLLILLYLLGFCAVSHPLTFFIPTFRGLGLGLSMGYMYTASGMKGILFCLALILPQALISTPLLIIAAAQSVKFSNMFLSLLIPGMKTEVSPKMLKNYCMRFFIIFLGLAIAAAADTLCVALFARFFV